MKEFVNYLREKIYSIFIFFLLLIVFALVYFLYDVRPEPFIYGCLLSSFMAIIYLLLGFLTYKRKRDHLKAIKNESDIDMLFEPKGQIEIDYQRIVREVHKDLLDKLQKKQEDFKDLEEFFIMWTHQIKLPISAINLYLDSEEDIKKSIVKGQLKRIEKYSDMVMAYIRLESEKNDFLFEEYNLDDLLKEAIKEFKLDFINKKLSLKYEAINRTIVTDKKWFIFVIEQVLSNALKYTKEGGVSIVQEGDKLVIEDSGIGISKEDMPRIFDKGYTGYNGRIKTEASGLGLFLVKRTMDKLQHGIKIESVVGQGTRVIIGLNKSEKIYD